MTEMGEGMELEDLGEQPDESILLPDVETVAPELELLEDVTQLYLNEIGAKPLLTPEEELDRKSVV